MSSWPSARISSGMQHAGPHSRNWDVYGAAVRLDPWFVTGLAEGEGCFCISFAIRPRLRVGLEARPSFSLSLNERDRELLGDLQAFFECGWIRESRSDRTFKYEARRWVSYWIASFRTSKRIRCAALSVAASAGSPRPAR